MMKKRKVAVVTGTRAEYGLLSCLLHEISADCDLQLQLIVTGMHLSPEFGLTYRFIEEDGFKIDAKVEMLMSSDTSIGTAKSIGIGIIGFTDVLSRLKPDILVLLGDRFECFAAAQAAFLHKIPIAHMHGGELSEGAIDDAIRHAITKMSQLHFVATESYRKRVIQLGENPQYVFNVGAPGLERIRKYTLLDRPTLEKKLGFPLGDTSFLVTYHPETLAVEKNQGTLSALLTALDCFPATKIIFTKSNADEAGRMINASIDQYVSGYPGRAIAFVSLGDMKYLSLLQYIDVMIGNSSSGIIEVPYFHKPTVNIGNRQARRLRATSVIDCQPEKETIVKAIQKALSNEFKADLKHNFSPYQQDNTAKRITAIIKDANLNALILKHFHDVEFPL